MGAFDSVKQTMVRVSDRIDEVRRRRQERSDDDSETEGGEDQVDFVFRLEDDRIVLDLSGPPAAVSETELELSRAIIEATVDQSTFESGRTTLVKRL